MNKKNEEKKPLFDPSGEYQSLRTELIDGRKFVFERPILIVMAAIAAFEFTGNFVINFVPAVLVLLLIFNLWFTFNRYRSLARISAYINVVLEGDFPVKWIGWETFLRYHRMWQQEIGIRKTESLALQSEHYNKQAATSGMMFYHAIYKFHKVIIISSIFVSFLLCYINITSSDFTVNEIVIPLLGVIATLIAFFKTKRYLRERAPSHIEGLIEKYRALCILTFEYIDTKMPKEK